MTRYIPHAADSSFLQQFLSPTLMAAKPYRIETPDCPVKLDQNECPWDFPDELKRRITDKVAQRSWNRYPPAFAEDLTAEIGKYSQMPADCVLTGPGSNHLLALLLSALGRAMRGKMIIARPSFPLYESHCQYDGIPYEPWLLDDELEYRRELLPEIPDGSVIVFASPNNPVGNVLPYDELKSLLTAHPTSMFVADEAYFEFLDRSYSQLLTEHQNLVLVRTFSKTLGAAGVRIGYLLGSPQLIAHLQKLRLPYLLNYFSVVAALEILRDPDMQAMTQRTISNVLSERQRVLDKLIPIARANGFHVKEPFANFFLLRWPEQDIMLKVYRGLIQQGVLVRNVSGAPQMSGCLRATIGTVAENDGFIRALSAVARS